MPTLDSVVKTVRIPRAEWEEIEKNLNGMSFCSYVRGLSENSGSKKGVLPDKLTKVLSELESMAMCFGMSAEELLYSLYRGLDSGYLTISDGEIVTECDVDITRFLKACEEKKVDPQKMIDKATEMVRNG